MKNGRDILAEAIAKSDNELYSIGQQALIAEYQLLAKDLVQSLKDLTDNINQSSLDVMGAVLFAKAKDCIMRAESQPDHEGLGFDHSRLDWLQAQKETPMNPYGPFREVVYIMNRDRCSVRTAIDAAKLEQETEVRDSKTP